MKYDIVRAWKDESYRQEFSEEDLNTLPANPAGMLNDDELACVCGGEHANFGGPGGLGAVAGSASSSARSLRAHSWSLLCDINVFSIDTSGILGGLAVINIATSTSQICASSD